MRVTELTPNVVIYHKLTLIQFTSGLELKEAQKYLLLNPNATSEAGRPASDGV